MPATKGESVAVSRPVGDRKDLFVFEMRRWRGPRPNDSTGQFHAYVCDDGAVARLVGCRGLSGAACLSADGTEIHVALATRIIRFEKRPGGWERAGDFPGMVAVTEFRALPTRGIVCWNTRELWRWDGSGWAAHAFPATRFGTPFAFADIRECQGVLYAVGYGGIVTVFDGAGWKEVQGPTRQDIQAAAVSGDTLLVAARTATDPAPGGIWKHVGGSWERLAVHEPPTVFRGLCVFRGRTYAVVEGTGICMIEGGALVPLAAQGVEKRVLQVHAGERCLFLSTPDEILFSEDGIRFASLPKAEPAALLPGMEG